MLAKRRNYTIYRKNNLSSNEWGEVVSQKEVIKENVTGGAPYLVMIDVKEDKYTTKKNSLRIVIDELLEMNEHDLHISDGTNEWRITQLVPYITFFNKTLVYVE